MDDPKSATADVLAALEKRFGARGSVSGAARVVVMGAEPESVATEPYQFAAAVLHVFDPLTLQPFGTAPDSVDPVTSVSADSTPAVGWRQARLRTLKPEVRKRLLARLGSREKMLEALRANADRVMTPVQRLFEQWLGGATLEIEGRSFADIDYLRQLSDWGLERFGRFPERRRLESARAERAAVGMFEHLVDEHFVGRQAELQTLRDYVGVVVSSRLTKVRTFLSGGQKAPLVVVGPGGSGKTALIGKFLLEHVDLRANGWFPIVYLPFDSETLDVREPFTLLVTAASQLSDQLLRADERSDGQEKLEKAFDDFRSVVGYYRDERAILRQRANTVSSQQRRLDILSEAENALYDSFAQLLVTISGVAGTQQNATEVPALLVFDTFEEVLYRTREELLGLWTMLSRVQKIFPSLRVVIASRVQPRPFKVGRSDQIVMQLGPLGDKDALLLLERLGVSDPSAAKMVFEQVGGNPLSLRLAARIWQDEESSGGISGLTTRKFFVFRLAPGLIRGQLYRRLLDHIHDVDVRLLAHPGMVLRRVTAEVIREVLAPVCGIEDVDEARSIELLDGLRRERTLVQDGEDGSLRFREEVRGPMLDLLVQDKPNEVKRIHQQAIDYYSALNVADATPNALQRAEEIYHRLMLGAEPHELASLWIDGVERYLISAINEIPVTQRTWLAERMSIELPAAAYKQADLVSWERLYGRKALEALRYEGPKRVLELLSERKERTPDSALFALEARAKLALDDPADAVALVDRALAGYPTVGNAGRLAELLWIRAQGELSMDRPAEAAETLRQLSETATTLASPIPRVQALTELLDLETATLPASAAATRAALVSALGNLSEEQVDAERSIVRLSLTRLGPGYAATTRRLVPLVISDWLYIVRERNIDVRPGLKEVQHLLRNSSKPSITALGDRLSESLNDSEAALAVVEEIIDLVQTGSDAKAADPHLTEVLLHVMKVEGATLRGSTLAGLDEYREPWELLAAPEAAA